MRSNWLSLSLAIAISTIFVFFSVTPQSKNTVLLVSVSLVVLCFVISAYYVNRSLKLYKELEQRVESNEIQLLRKSERYSGFQKLPVSASEHLQQQSSAGSEAQEMWLEKVLDLIQERYDDPEFGTSSASKYLFVSERSLQRKFKSQTNQTFTEYLTNVRLERSCHLLKQGDKVSDVALNTGFNDPSYFSQKFKSRFGVSPSKYALVSEPEQDSKVL